MMLLWLLLLLLLSCQRCTASVHTPTHLARDKARLRSV